MAPGGHLAQTTALAPSLQEPGVRPHLGPGVRGPLRGCWTEHRAVGRPGPGPVTRAAVPLASEPQLLPDAPCPASTDRGLS